MDISKIRALFPVTQEAIYLNSASQAPLNTLVNSKLQNYLAAELNFKDKIVFNRDAIRAPLAKLLGGSKEEYALTTSTGVGLGIIAQGIHFKKGDNIVIPEKEHWNNAFPWLNLQHKGVEVRFAKLDNKLRLNPDAIEKLVDHKTRLVAVAAVRFNSGFRPDLSKISKIAHAKKALFVVDAAQGAGMIPIDVKKEGIDILSGCGFKWLLGMHGTGFLYVSNHIVNQIRPVLPGMYAAKINYDELDYHTTAQKFETGTLAYPLFYAWSAGLELLNTVGIQAIYQKIIKLTDTLINGLLQKNYIIISPVENIADRTAIIHFNSGSLKATKALFEKLKRNKVLVSLQGEHIRVSPSFFTTPEEIKNFLTLL